MKNEKTYLYIGLGVSLVALAGIGIGLQVRRSRNKEELAALLAKINETDTLKGGAGKTGTSSDIYDADIWNPSIYFNKAGISPPTLSIAMATPYADEIHDAKGFAILPDNPPQILAALRHARNRTDIAKIADAFAVKYREPMDVFMGKIMNKSGKWFTDGRNYNDDIQNLIMSLPK